MTHWLICAQVCVRGLALGLLLLHEEPRREEDVVGVPVLTALLRHRTVPDHSACLFIHPKGILSFT